MILSTGLCLHWDRWIFRALGFVVIFVLLFSSIHTYAQGEEAESDKSELEDLLKKEPEELQDIVVYVTTASRRPEKLWETAAAAYVISTTEIQRSAATSVVDLLRMVPGLFVGNLTSNFSIYGIRGYAYEFSVDILVLVDGRQVSFVGAGGVFWSIQDYSLEDIERIEVILGPGGTLWGTNSGNGVINIITKHSRDTQGGLITGIAGTDLYRGVIRYGGKIGEDAFYRVYGLYKDVDDFNDMNGNESVDDWALGKGGFRIDWQPSNRDELTFQGDAFHEDVWNPKPLRYYPPGFYSLGQTRFRSDKVGQDLLFEWNRAFDNDSKLKWLTYYDFLEWDWEPVSEITYHTFKTDFQYQFSPITAHEFVIGAGYRLVSNDTENRLVEFVPSSSNDQTVTAFVQDNITLIEEELNMSLGALLQYSDYSEWDYQPNVKLVYTPYDCCTLWAAVTRSAQHFYRFHYSAIAPTASPNPFASEPLVFYDNAVGDIDSQKILSFELGQRLQVATNLSFELSAYYNIMDDMYSLEADMSSMTLLNEPVPHYRIFQNPGNKVSGESYGAELALHAQVNDFWKLSASYSVLDMQLHKDEDSTERVFSNLENVAPSHQVKVLSYFDITRDVKLDVAYYFIDKASLDIYMLNVPQHSRLDIRLGWQPNEKVELSVVGTNLLDSQTFETAGFFMQPTEVERGVYAKLTYRF